MSAGNSETDQNVNPFSLDKTDSIPHHSSYNHYPVADQQTCMRLQSVFEVTGKSRTNSIGGLM